VFVGTVLPGEKKVWAANASAVGAGIFFFSQGTDMDAGKVAFGSCSGGRAGGFVVFDAEKRGGGGGGTEARRG